MHFQLFGRLRLAHRMAWLYVYGVEPEKGLHIDHINGIKIDNRIDNLRVVTVSGNVQNQRKARVDNTHSGLLGSHWDKKSGKYNAVINVNKVRIFLGAFADPMEAHQAYLTAKRELHATCTI